MLFRGYIVKDWFGDNDSETKYHEANKIIVRQCVRWYQKCWTQRNTYVQLRKVKRTKLIGEIEDIKDIFLIQKNLTSIHTLKIARKISDFGV